MNSPALPIAPGSLARAHNSLVPELMHNLTNGSGWMALIQELDDPERSNSPYYGPATQHLVDTFLHIAAANPGLQHNYPTPHQRTYAAQFIIEDYIGQQAVGHNGVLKKAYDLADVSQTLAHQNRSLFFVLDTDHILSGATVPFVDISRNCGGAALLLSSEGVPEDEIPDRVLASSKLKIIAGLDGTRTPGLANAQGNWYVKPEYLTVAAEGTVEFTSEAMATIRTYMSKFGGCPTGKLSESDGTLFDKYWRKIGHHLLDDVDYDLMKHELSIQPKKVEVKKAVPRVISRQAAAKALAAAAGLNSGSSQSKPTFSSSDPKKPKPRATKRYTPPKRK